MINTNESFIFERVGIMKAVGLSGSIIGSKTSICVDEVLKKISMVDPEIETELVDLKDYDVEFVRGVPLSSYNEDTQKVVSKILEADVLVIGTPIYQASIPGVLKNLFDHLPPDVFMGKIVGTVTTGGSDKHFLVTEYQLRPILSYFKAIISTNNVFIHNSCFDINNVIIDKEVQSRMYKLAEELVTLEKINRSY